MNIPSTFQTVIEHFKKNGWIFQLAAGQPVLTANFRGKNGNFRLVVFVDEADNLFQVFGFLSLIAPAHKQAAITELCVRLSFAMKMGRFEVDPNDGEIRFQTYSAFPPGQLTDDVVRRVVGVNLLMVDQNFPAFAAVIYANQSPEEAATQTRARIASGQPTGPEPQLQMPARLTLN
ncbi:MAG: hypothetical protein C5B50_00465 [Verrucomicrobia bacterium]|nr:MAG: hypothetical protein C5B50_00465 [Verrucomicrobiota bacterium]